MPDPRPLPLSSLLTRAAAACGSRRAFLARASVLGLAVPGWTVALWGCGKTRSGFDDAGGQAGDSLSKGGAHPPVVNPDSRADSLLRHDVPSSSATPGALAGAASVTFRRYDPILPPVASERVTRLDWTAREVPIRISSETAIAAWTFEGDLPGPIVHVRQGDTIEFTLTNGGHVPHSMDFHAAQVDPRTAFRSVAAGRSVTYTFKPRYAGAFVYHCGTAPVLLHLGSGMYGAIIVDPVKPLPPAREFVLVQSELYLGAARQSVQTSDYTEMLSTLPDSVVFNGRPGQYQAEPMRAQRGELVRFYVVNAGPTHPCNFHVVGEQFDTVYLGAPPETPIHGVQTFGVAPGGGMLFEMRTDIPGEFVFVNHGFGHGQKGAVGVLVVED